MKRVHFLEIVAILSLVSCSKTNNYIYYTYNNTTITRIDDGTDIYLYPGRLRTDDSLPNTYVKARYQGFDGYMECLAIFKDNGNVEIIREGAIFDTINTGMKIRMIEFSNITNSINWYEKKKGNYNNIIKLSSALNFEIKQNKINHSNVKAEYPK